MKIHPLSILCCFLFLLSFKHANAQQDFIVTSKGDTIKGEVKNIFLGKKHRFKKEGSEEFITIRPDSVKEYYRADKKLNYLAKVRPDKENLEFLKRLENGEIQLFECIVGSGGMVMGSPMGGGFGGSYAGGSSTIWYASKNGSPLKEIKAGGQWGGRAKRVKNFYELIGDNEALAAEFKAADIYSFDALQECIQKYNSQKVLPVSLNKAQ